MRLIREFTRNADASRSSSTPTRAASAAAPTLAEAWDKAYATDRQAPFGGIIVVNRPLDLAVAQLISEIFSEVIIAPGFRRRTPRASLQEEEPAPDDQQRDRPRPRPASKSAPPWATRSSSSAAMPTPSPPPTGKSSPSARPPTPNARRSSSAGAWSST